MNFKKSYKSIGSTIAAVAVLLQGSTAFGLAVESARCSVSKDSLSAAQAIERTKWARKCFPQNMGFLGATSVSGGVDMLADGKIVLGYPTFAVAGPNGVGSTPWIAPVDSTASCEGSAAYVMVGFCLAGCYTNDQQVLFGDGYRAIGEQSTKSQSTVMALSPESTLDRLSYAPRPLKQIVKDLEPGEQEILHIQTAGDGELKVTLNHPLVDGQGHMRRADTLKLGEQLVREDGSLDAITSITKQTIFDRVYNVEVEGQDPMQQIVLAQGFLNGSIYYQNDGVKDLNRQFLRRSTLISNWVLTGQ